MWARRKGIVADCARARCQAVTVIIAGAEFAGENQDQEDTGEEVGLLLITSAGLVSVQVPHQFLCPPDPERGNDSTTVLH